MLIKAKSLANYRLDSLDGEVGDIIDFYFDDHCWTIRYLVVETGSWFRQKWQVLISPYSFNAVVHKNHHINIKLTNKLIQDSPSWRDDKPISRQFEEIYNKYYGWPMYWGSTSVWGHLPYPVLDNDLIKNIAHVKKDWDHHLRSMNHINGYKIQASDGEIGHVDDFIIDNETWTIRYLVVSTQNWWPRKKVLVSPRWVEHVSWKESKVSIQLSLDTIRNSPEYIDESLLTRNYETRLYDHYHSQGYWDDDIETDRYETKTGDN